MIRFGTHARAARPGVVVSLSGVLVVCTLMLACGSREPSPPAGPRMWEGPGTAVASTGTITFERREIAQKVLLPACLIVGSDRYRFVRVTTFPGGGSTPPGLTDTFYRLDRWRLWTPGGPPIGQATLSVTIRGSTGILAEYSRLTPGEPCPA